MIVSGVSRRFFFTQAVYAARLKRFKYCLVEMFTSETEPDHRTIDRGCVNRDTQKSMPRAKTPKEKKKSEERVFPIVWKFPDELLGRYATNMLIQQGDQEFFVSFFEMRPPVLLTPEDVTKIENVQAQCIATIIVSPDRLDGFIKAFQQSLNNFNAKKAASENGSK
jgi:hypothetical protein